MAGNLLLSPMLKWVGGKRQLLSEIVLMIDNKCSTYVEPFIGGGIVYHLICKRWSDVFLMSLIFATIMVVLLAIITIQDWCDTLIEKIGTL